MAEPEMEVPWPLTTEEREAVTTLMGRLGTLEDQTGGWTVKIDNRQTGLSLYVKFDKKVDVLTTMSFADLLVDSPTRLYALCARLLAADDSEKEWQVREGTLGAEADCPAMLFMYDGEYEGSCVRAAGHDAPHWDRLHTWRDIPDSEGVYDIETVDLPGDLATWSAHGG